MNRNLPLKFGQLLCLAACFTSAATWAEKADRTQPITIEADSANLDQQKGQMVYEGNVILTQGSLLLKASKIVATDKGNGQQQATAVGSPAYFKQRLDAKEGHAAEWVEGQAKRIDYDSSSEEVRLVEQARIKRGQDSAVGHSISYHGKTEVFQVNGGGKNGRVTVILQPKSKP